ncbi:MAG: NAD(P)-dependent oxidoreductase [Pyrinomonadaceae bacterium]|nr:NAD(P)-dependent oxidoreductase [Pyrinomonadaceae bacterium]MCX7640142.1 NAD(P)-dependent oxidoreductase [Pyrinomonadaceae bacterium]MDW8303270.1 NAD(P)-dependent oxidoreductase [Acidobacteriota bacterium]
MRVLVTGGSGFLGTWVRAFFNADDFSRRSNLDLLNLQDTNIVNGYDVVIHLAALLDKSTEAIEEVFLTNVEGTVNLLRSMRKNAVFIFASTKDVYGRFADNYKFVPETCPTLYSGQSALEWSKLIAEHYVAFYAHQIGFRYCIFRLSTVYAPLTEGNTPNFVTHYAESIKKGTPIRLPTDCDPIRDILHVSDFSFACKAFIESVLPNGIYNLGGGYQNALSLRELIKKMEEISGLEAIIDDKNPLPKPVPVNYISDLTKVNQELGWYPSISIEEGLKSLF